MEFESDDAGDGSWWDDSETKEQARGRRRTQLPGASIHFVWGGVEKDIFPMGDDPLNDADEIKEWRAHAAPEIRIGREDALTDADVEVNPEIPVRDAIMSDAYTELKIPATEYAFFCSESGESCTTIDADGSEKADGEVPTGRAKRGRPRPCRRKRRQCQRLIDTLAAALGDDVGELLEDLSCILSAASPYSRAVLHSRLRAEGGAESGENAKATLARARTAADVAQLFEGMRQFGEAGKVERFVQQFLVKRAQEHNVGLSSNSVELA